MNKILPELLSEEQVGLELMEKDALESLMVGTGMSQSELHVGNMTRGKENDARVGSAFRKKVEQIKSGKGKEKYDCLVLSKDCSSLF